MEGVWLVSYVALWALVLFEAMVISLLVRELGMRLLSTAASRMNDGIQLGKRAPLVGTADALPEGSRFLIFGSARCGPCRTLAPDINRFARKHPELGVYFVTSESQDSADLTARELQLLVPVIGDRRAADEYEVRATPFAFVIDEAGLVAAKGLVSQGPALEWLLRQAPQRNTEPTRIQASLTGK